MKNLTFFVRNYKYDLLTALFASILYIISFRFATNQNMVLLLSLLITILSASIIVFVRLRDKDFYDISFTKPEHKNDWIGEGIFDYSRVNRSFQITNTDPGGYIFSKCLTWNNYKYEFEFKLINKCLGAIVRAINLSNLVMLQITPNGLRPHISINGGYYVWEAKDVNLEFTKALSLDRWYKCQIFCDNRDITIRIFSSKEKIFDRQWKIPRGKIEFSFPKDEKDKNPTKIYFPINLEYGSVGFRNSDDEKALIKNVLIEKI